MRKDQINDIIEDKIDEARFSLINDGEDGYEDDTYAIVGDVFTGIDEDPDEISIKEVLEEIEKIKQIFPDGEPTIVWGSKLS